ncbi:hypothetical protein BT63DRAFT_456234 [Microthyrium microscopicum]|uniref:Uncharacterized protein n=1 Tax=Microthyrium microscopicum TaxID=703497 RepID=A0A6A6UAG8_9PEZI|nr:hypothetical protein BT63DRAFT_456234 [Microthyrium microscopicum]
MFSTSTKKAAVVQQSGVLSIKDMINRDKLRPTSAKATGQGFDFLHLRGAWIVDLTERVVEPQTRTIMQHQIPPPARVRTWGLHNFETVVEVYSNLPHGPKSLQWYVDYAPMHMGIRQIIGFEIVVTPEFEHDDFAINRAVMSEILEYHGSHVAQIVNYVQNKLYHGLVQSIEVKHLKDRNAYKYSLKLICLPHQDLLEKVENLKAQRSLNYTSRGQFSANTALPSVSNTSMEEETLDVTAADLANLSLYPSVEPVAVDMAGFSVSPSIDFSRASTGNKENIPPTNLATQTPRKI